MKQLQNKRVVAVVVAYNRQTLLADTLNGLAEQTRPVDAVVVIDNASTDGSAALAKAHPVVDRVVSMPENLGGAGGFAGGIAVAMSDFDADYVWLMDDDTAPHPPALAQLLKAIAAYPGQVAIAAVKALWFDGREHPMNRPRPRPLLDSALAAKAAQIGCVPIRSASFVGPLIDARAIRETGLPVADYFLWNDDFEYTARILRRRIGLYVPAATVLHQTKKFGDSAADPGPRFENEVRNKLWMYFRSNALNPVETLLYGGKSVLRWGKTIATSKQRGPLLKWGWAGLLGALQAPRSNRVIFASTPLLQQVCQVEQPCAGREPSSPTKFSVLMSVYRGDQPDHFRRALESVTLEQELQPTELVLVQDGPVAAELAREISDTLKRVEAAGIAVKRVQLAENVGLARALNAGLAAASNELIARADADDISLPQRFKVQLPLLRDFDLVGSAIAEFESDENQTALVRTHPSDPQQIARAARLRDPFNHPSVVYRAASVAAAGGYQHLERMEDYLLFARMLARGARATNVPEALVKYRVGAGAYQRRGGWDMFASELQLQRLLRDEGFTGRAQYLRNLAVRGLYRLIPTGVRRGIYRTVGAGSWFRAAPKE